MRLAGVAQFTTDPLLLTQQITLGGPAFGRAYTSSERTGDEGVMGSVELRSDFSQLGHHIDWVQPYVFFDGGKVRSIGDTLADGALYSSGGGVRTRIGKSSINLETAFPLNAQRLETGNKTPRFNMQLSFPW